MAASSGVGGGEKKPRFGGIFRKGSKSKSLSDLEFQPLTEDKWGKRLSPYVETLFINVLCYAMLCTIVVTLSFTHRP